MKPILIRAFIVAFGLLGVAVVGVMLWAGNTEPNKELDGLASRLDADPATEHLRELLNYPADAGFSFYKMALVGRAFIRHPTAFKQVAGDLRTDEERWTLQTLCTHRVRQSLLRDEHHPTLMPPHFEQCLAEQKWLTEFRMDEL
jgi:hypothetical protein